MNYRKFQLSILGVLVFATASAIGGLILLHKIFPSKFIPTDSKSNEVRFYGKVVNMSGDIIDTSTGQRYFSGIFMIRYVDCNKDGKSEFEGVDKESIKRLYSKPALVSNMFARCARIGDIVMIVHASYKSGPGQSIADHYNQIAVAVPLDSETVPPGL